MAVEKAYISAKVGTTRVAAKEEESREQHPTSLKVEAKAARKDFKANAGLVANLAIANGTAQKPNQKAKVRTRFKAIATSVENGVIRRRIAKKE